MFGVVRSEMGVHILTCRLLSPKMVPYLGMSLSDSER